MSVIWIGNLIKSALEVNRYKLKEMNFIVFPQDIWQIILNYACENPLVVNLLITTRIELACSANHFPWALKYEQHVDETSLTMGYIHKNYFVGDELLSQDFSLILKDILMMTNEKSILSDHVRLIFRSFLYDSIKLL